MNNRQSGAEGSCRHRDAHSEALLKKHGHDCPVDLSFWCANDILADIRKLEFDCRTRHESHEKRLRAEFGGILERNLSQSYDCESLQVLWSLDEKSIEAHGHDILGGGPRQRAISKALLELNADYRSHPLLWQLVGFSLGRSHVFSVKAESEGPCLIVRPLRCLSPEKSSQEWPIPIPLNGGHSVLDLLTVLRTLPDKAAPELNDEIKAIIKDQINAWVPDPPKPFLWPQGEFEARLRDEERQDASGRHFDALFRDAAKHIALMSIYMACNDFGTISYILAPTLEERSETSSLVVCWPRLAGEGSLNLLYLLQMILGQNATAILGEQRERRKYQQLAEARKMALGHLGHTLKNRLDTVQAFLDQHAGKAMSNHVLMLSDLAIILQLNTVDDQEELLALESKKRDRFLEYADTESARPLDLKGRIMHDWPELVAREQSYGKDSHTAWCRLKMRSGINDAHLAFALKDEGRRSCRVTEVVYRELLFELLLNARRYGYVQPCPDETHDGVPVVSVRCNLGTARIDGRDVLTLVNQVHLGKELPPHLQSTEWSRWPAEGKRKFDGPGMAVGLIRRLGIGDLFFRSQTLAGDRTFFSVGLDLLGLEMT